MVAVTYQKGDFMEFGFNIPTRGALASTENILALARRGEALGFS